MAMTWLENGHFLVVAPAGGSTATTTFICDSLNRLTSVTDDQYQTIIYSYDLAGFVCP
jgi:hypothetical protein